MKKLDGIKYCIFLIVFLFSICMIGCSNTESNAENKYEFGTMENIDDKFEIVNSRLLCQEKILKQSLSIMPKQKMVG